MATSVFAVERIVDGSMVIDGIFSTEERAAAICGPDSAVVRFDLDRDCTDERTFDVGYPARGLPLQPVTA